MYTITCMHIISLRACTAVYRNTRCTHHLLYMQSVVLWYICGFSLQLTRTRRTWCLYGITGWGLGGGTFTDNYTHEAYTCIHVYICVPSKQTPPWPRLNGSVCTRCNEVLKVKLLVLCRRTNVAMLRCLQDCTVPMQTMHVHVLVGAATHAI